MDGIQRFWDSFSRIRGRLSRNPPDAAAMDLLRDVLLALEPRLFYHLRSNERGLDLILSAEGHAELMPLLDRVSAAAPALPGWSVQPAYEGMLLFGERNEAVFPDDANGDVLYQMGRNGDHLWKPRDIHFSLTFPDQPAAEKFRGKVARLGMRCTVDGSQAEVTMHLAPGWTTITGLEQSLSRAAAEYGGRSQGWGCFPVR